MTHRIPQKEPPQGLRPGKHIERFVRVQSRKGGRRHVSDGVATRLAQSDFAGLQLGPQGRAVLQFDVVDLNVLPGGEVVLSGAVFVAHVQDGPELIKGQQAHGHLNADHLNAGLTLSVDAARKAQAAEAFLVDFAFAKEKDAPVQVENVSLNDGVVDFVDEAEHGVGVSSHGHEKRPPVGEAFLESDAGKTGHIAVANLPESGGQQQQQHAL